MKKIWPTYVACSFGLFLVACAAGGNTSHRTVREGGADGATRSDAEADDGAVTADASFGDEGGVGDAAQEDAAGSDGGGGSDAGRRDGSISEPTRKYNPGFYSISAGGAETDGRLDHFAGILGTYRWSDLAPTPSTFDFSVIYADLDRLASRPNKQVVIEVRIWGGYTIPGWIRTDPIYGWAGVTTSGYRTPETYRGETRRYGVAYYYPEDSPQIRATVDEAPVSILYTNEALLEKLLELNAALAAEFDSHPQVEAIVTLFLETSKFGFPRWSGWDWGSDGRKTRAQIYFELTDDLRSRLVHTRTLTWITYLDSSFRLGSADDQLRDLIDREIANNDTIVDMMDGYIDYRPERQGHAFFGVEKGDRLYRETAMHHDYGRVRDRAPTAVRMTPASLWETNRNRHRWLRDGRNLVVATPDDFIDLYLGRGTTFSEHPDVDVRNFWIDSRPDRSDVGGGPSYHYVFCIGYPERTGPRRDFMFGSPPENGFAQAARAYLDAGGTVPPAYVRYGR